MPDDNRQGSQQLMHDENAWAYARLNSALCFLNATVKANPLNLCIIWGMLKSDVLTFLGLHNQTWRWMMYCMQVAPLFGHLRTQTEDGHAARGECIFTAKPNSVGLNEVIVKTVNFCLEGMLSSVVSLTDEDRKVLKLDKVDRRTRASMEASQVYMLLLCENMSDSEKQHLWTALDKVIGLLDSKLLRVGTLKEAPEAEVKAPNDEVQLTFHQDPKTLARWESSIEFYVEFEGSQLLFNIRTLFLYFKASPRAIKHIDGYYMVPSTGVFCFDCANGLYNTQEREITNVMCRRILERTPNELLLTFTKKSQYGEVCYYHIRFLAPHTAHIGPTSIDP